MVLTLSLSYLLLGLAYWASSMTVVGMPHEVLALPRAARWRVTAATAVYTTLLWPMAVVHDLGRLRG